MYLGIIMLFPHTKLSLFFFLQKLSGRVISNTLGQQVLYEKKVGNHSELNVSKLAEGTYFLQVNTGDKLHNSKFIVVK